MRADTIDVLYNNLDKNLLSYITINGEANSKRIIAVKYGFLYHGYKKNPPIIILRLN